MPEVANVTWTRDLSGLIENRSSKRTAVNPNQRQAWRLTGIDGFSKAGLRPFPGFKKLSEGLGLTSGQTLQRGDFFVVTLPVDFDTAFTGYLYRYRDGASGPYKTKLKWYDGSSWNTSSDIFSLSNKQPLTYAVAGRVLYVFIKGQEPAALFFDESTGALTIQNDTGPGPRPSSVKVGDKSTTSYLGSSTCLNNATGDYQDLPVGRIIVNDQIDALGDGYPTFESPPAAGSDKPTGQTPLKYQPGHYSFAFEMVNSKTNRKSQLSEIVELEPEDFKDAVSVTTTTTYNYGKRSYLLFEVLIDTNKYDQVYLYRSVRNPPNTTAGPLQSALFLEKILTSDDNLYPDTPTDLSSKVSAAAGTAFERWYFYCVLDDQALLVQDPYFNRVVVDDDMPEAGAALYYEGIMVTSNIGANSSNPVPNQSNVGEIRYSSTLTFSPESFPPNNRVVPPSVTDTPVAWIQASGNALGLSQSRVYFTRASGGFIEFEPIANGYGLAARRAVASISELVFYLSATGIKVMDANGALNAMSAFDEVIREDWATTLTDCFMVYDPESKVLFTINPDRYEALLVWMETSTPSSLQDVPFVAASSGLVPASGSSQDRAQFAASNGLIYVYDRTRTKVDGSGNTRVAMLDWSGPGYAVVDSVGSPTAGIYPVTLTSGGFPSNGDLTNAFVYVATGARRGDRFRVLAVDVSGDDFSLEPQGAADATALVGQTLEISPIFVRWVDAPIDLQSPDGYQFGLSDRFRNRTVATMAVYFSDSDGPPVGSVRATYSATLWRGNLGTTYSWGQPLGRTGEIVPAIADHNPDYSSLFQRASVLPVTSSVVAPGLDIFVTDLDYVAVAARINGKIEHTSRTRGHS